MTEIFINIPERLDISENRSLGRTEIPIIPAEKVSGILDPSQIPVGVIPGVEDVIQIQSEIETLSNRVSDLEDSPALDPAALSEHTEQFGPGGHIPLFGITNDDIAAGAAIAASKLDFAEVDFVELGAQPASTKLLMISEREVTEFGADLLETLNLTALKTLLEIPLIVDDPGDIGAQPADADLTAIAQLITTTFGRSFLALADAAAARALLQIPLIVDSSDDIGAQPVDADLTAIAQLTTTTFGRSFLALADAAAARALLQIPLIVDDPGDIGAQPADADLTAIAQLTTTAFGRSLLTQVDAAAVLSLLGISGLGSNSGSNSPPTISELTYTASQSSNYNDASALAGTYSTLTDGNATTGAATKSASSTGQRQWIKADLGSVKWVQGCAFSGGTLGNGFGGVSTYLNAATIQISTDDSTWLNCGTVTNAVNSFSLQWFSVGTWTRYIRLLDAGSFLATTEFRISGA